VKRRQFITLIGGAAIGWPLAARAQQPIRPTGKMPHVGVLMPGPAAYSAATLDPFYSGLHDLGYVEGQNLSLERRNADWKPDRLPALAAELVGTPQYCYCSYDAVIAGLELIPKISAKSAKATGTTRALRPSAASHHAPSAQPKRKPATAGQVRLARWRALAIRLGSRPRNISLDVTGVYVFASQ
jgi:hypothetical protein